MPLFTRHSHASFDYLLSFIFFAGAGIGSLIQKLLEPYEALVPRNISKVCFVPRTNQ